MQFSLESAIRQAYKLIQIGNFQGAIAIANNLIKTRRNDPRSWNLLCEINRERGTIAHAIHCASQAAKLSPTIPNYQLQLARCLAIAGRRAEALDAVEKVLEFDTKQASLLDAIGSVYSMVDEQARALHFYHQAASSEPANASFLYNLAACQRMTGRLADAQDSCDRVIELDPNWYEAYYVRSDLRKWTAEHNHVQQLRTVLDQNDTTREAQIFLGFALAKELEDIGEYRESFQYRRSACDLKRQSMRYRVGDDIESIDYLISKHTRSALQAASQSAQHVCNSDEPIFVVGLPRSGTTLVDRILGSHSRVYSAGELNDFAYALVAASEGGATNQALSKKQLVDKSLSLDLGELGHNYLRRTRPRTGHTPHFVDKLPLNYLYCGLIHASVPNAKIILLQRNAMDVCYAMYKTLFTSPYPFTYDQADIALYYLAYRRLVSHWQTVLGDRLFTMRYEDLVFEQETSTRRLLEHCNLPWEQGCLEFHNNRAASSTASAVQVRQPIYSSSVGLWRKYEDGLAPLKQLLVKNGVEVA